MERLTILIDTSVLIDYYRKTDKNNSLLMSLLKRGYQFVVSSITKYEVYSGATTAQTEFWSQVFAYITILPLDEKSVDEAVAINTSLKKQRKQIDLADLLIAATAMSHQLPVATLNRKHFERIEGLLLLS